MRKFWMTALMMTVAAAGAQTIGVTTDSGPDAVSVGARSASVNQTVNLKLPEATALHLDATTLTFDISQIGNQDGTWYCAYGKGDGTDQSSQLGADFWNQTQVKPLGTSYSLGSEWGKITVDAGAKVTQYPPIKVGTDGEVDNASKAYFVCYRAFIIQKFSNVGNFKLSVSRDNPAAGAAGRQLMYIQDNPCSTFGGATGLYKLNPGSARELIPMRMTSGTTGARAAGTTGKTQAELGGGTNVCRSYTSWLDDLVVVAVVVDGDRAGDNNAILTYTLESSAAPFVIADSDAKN
jgi:hypothetical protein